MPKTVTTDPALYVKRPMFGIAGGPDVVALTEEGRLRSFAVGAQIRRDGPAQALLALWYDKTGYLVKRVTNSVHLRLTDLGRINQIEWMYLQECGLVESFVDDGGNGVRLTSAGKSAVERGFEEQRVLLTRCQASASAGTANEITSSQINEGRQNETCRQFDECVRHERPEAMWTWTERQRMRSLAHQAATYGVLSPTEGQTLGRLIQQVVTAGILTRS